MNMLYDSESFVVMHFQPEVWASEPMPAMSSAAQAIRVDAGLAANPAESEYTGPKLARNGFEIVDKRSGKEIYLDGSWAELFQAQITEWQRNTPTQEEVEDTLDRYTALAHQPVVVH
jgi:hypothetical protein